MLIKPNYTKVISDFKSLQSVLIVMILCRAIRVVIYGHPHMKMDPVFGGLSLYGLPYTIDMVLGLIFIIILILEWKLANSCRDAGIISVHPVIIFALMLSLFILFKVNRGIDVGALFFWVTKFQGHTT